MAPAHAPCSSHQCDIIRQSCRERGAWFSLHNLDRTEAGRKHTDEAEAMEDTERKKKDKNSSKDDRVTLKKEIGLLSACAIIIGECLTAYTILHAVSEAQCVCACVCAAKGEVSPQPHQK